MGKKTRPRQFSIKPARCNPGLRATRLPWKADSLSHKSLISRDSRFCAHSYLSFFLYNVYLTTLFTSKWVQAVTLLTCTREGFGSNLGLDTNHRAALSTSNAFDLYSAGTHLAQSPAVLSVVFRGFTQYLKVYVKTIPQLLRFVVLLRISRQLSKQYPDCGLCWFYSVSRGKRRHNTVWSFVVSLSISRQMSKYLKFVHDHFFPRPFRFIIIQSFDAI
jgi:hypothetical protein